MVLEFMTPRRWDFLSPASRDMQQALEAELDRMVARFPDAMPKDLKRFLMGNQQKADKAIPAFEAHLKW